MPRDSFKPLTPQEQKFVFHFVREGCHEEKLYLVERKARIPKGKAAEILRRKHVAIEVERRRMAVEMEQNRLIARDQNRNAEEEDKRRSVTLDKIEAALDKIIALPAEKYGTLVLNGIQTGLVYTGTMRNGRMERIAPPPKEDPAASSFYRSIFDPMRQSVAADVKQPEVSDAAPLYPDDALPARQTPVSQPASQRERPKGKSVQVDIT